MHPVAADDLVAFRSAGAYGAVMASEYNSRPLVPEVLVSGDRFAVVRARPSYEDMLARDAMPDWLEADAEAKPTPEGNRSHGTTSRSPARDLAHGRIVLHEEDASHRERRHR